MRTLRRAGSQTPSLRLRIALADNLGMRWDWFFLGLGVVLVVVVAVLLMRASPGDPNPRRADVAVDCATGGGWIGYDGKTHCP